MRMAPTAAMDVPLGLLPLHVMIKVEACSQQWKPKSTNFGNARKHRDMERESLLQIGTDMMIPWYEYHQPFTFKFPHTCEWQSRFKLDIKGGLVWYMSGSWTI
jgi:hypothetical protein